MQIKEERTDFWYSNWMENEKNFRLCKLHAVPLSCFVMQYSEAMVFFLGMRPSAVKAEKHPLVIH